jgi:hypothetical protein
LQNLKACPGGKPGQAIKVKLRIKIIFAAVTVAFCFSRSFAASDFGVAPAIVEISAKANHVLVGTFTVVNKSSDSVSVTIVYENWLKRKGYKNEISKIAPLEWLKIKPDSFDMDPKSYRLVNYYIHMPEKVQGELVAMAFFSPKSKKGRSFLNIRFGVCVYAVSEGTEKIECKVIETKVIKQEKSKDLKFVVKLENSGNVHIRPEVNIEITKGSRKIKDIEFYRGLALYPGKSHTYVTEWKDTGLTSGKYKAQAKINYGIVHGLRKSEKGKSIKFINEKYD